MEGILLYAEANTRSQQLTCINGNSVTRCLGQSLKLAVKEQSPGRIPALSEQTKDGTLNETHAQTMDRTYRLMKHVYDVTRPFFLAGRSAIRQRIVELSPVHVAEIGCGTGRNIILLARQLPQTLFTGLDISQQMLDFAKGKAGKAGIADKVQFVLGDASSADIGTSVDLAFFSYSLSMIPDWKSALHGAAEALAPGGTLLIVDFSSMDGWPVWARERVRKNLNWYNVQPRTELASYFRNTPDFMNWSISHREMLGSYAQIVELTKPKSGTAA